MILREGRTVYTHLVRGVPMGFITGYPHLAGFNIEAFVAFRPSIIRPMLQDALEVAWARYAFLTFVMPRTFVLAKRLVRLATRLGFKKYESIGELDYYVLWRPR